jgi:hypothetical protein
MRRQNGAGGIALALVLMVGGTGLGFWFINTQAKKLKAAATGPPGQAKPAATGATRIVIASGGYTYQQNPDGSIVILKSPISGGGAVLTSGTAWTEITKEIGAYSGLQSFW